MRIVFATGNQNKMREIHEIMDDLGMEIVSMKEAGISADIVEDGTSFEENAVIKASAIARQCEDIVLADDSGLEVDALNKEPGIYSARYMGEDTSYRIKNQSIIDRLEGVPDEKRSARFVCAVAAVFPDGSLKESFGSTTEYEPELPLRLNYTLPLNYTVLLNAARAPTSCRTTAFFLK